MRARCVPHRPQRSRECSEQSARHDPPAWHDSAPAAGHVALSRVGFDHQLPDWWSDDAAALHAGEVGPREREWRGHRWVTQSTEERRTAVAAAGTVVRSHTRSGTLSSKLEKSHPKTLSSRDTFIRNRFIQNREQFHPMTLSSKNYVIQISLPETQPPEPQTPKTLNQNPGHKPVFLTASAAFGQSNRFWMKVSLYDKIC